MPMLKVFCDGSYCATNDTAGWGVVIVNDRGRQQKCSGAGLAFSSSKIELYALLKGIEIASRRDKVLKVYVDCLEIVNGYQRAIKDAKYRFKSKLWTKVIKLSSKIDVEVIWKRRISCRNTKAAHILAHNARLRLEGSMSADM